MTGTSMQTRSCVKQGQAAARNVDKLTLANDDGPGPFVSGIVVGDLRTHAVERTMTNSVTALTPPKSTPGADV